MERVEGYVHQDGIHCGATALRNVTSYYGLEYDEPSCFGIGGGIAFVTYARAGESWSTFRASPLWLESAFFERTGIPHRRHSGDDFQTAWDRITGHIDEDDPVILFLDPAALPYLPESDHHVPPHVVVAVGYDEGTLTVSDGTMESRQRINKEILDIAWRSDRYLFLDHEYLVVTRAARIEEGTDAAAAGLRHTARYMLDPLTVDRNARGPGQEGLDAMEQYRQELTEWAGQPAPIDAAIRAIDEHGNGSAYRALYADALRELGRRTGLPMAIADRLDGIAQQWQTVLGLLEDSRSAPEIKQQQQLQEVSTTMRDIINREQDIFEEIQNSL